VVLTVKVLIHSEWGGQGGGSLVEKGLGGLREAGEEGAESGIPKVAGSGRKGKNYATMRNISKGKGSGRFKPPCPPPPTSEVFPTVLSEITKRFCTPIGICW